MERIFWLKWTLYDDKVSELKTQKLYVENKHKGVLYFMFLNRDRSDGHVHVHDNGDYAYFY
jgi:hypothetical protein